MPRSADGRRARTAPDRAPPPRGWLQEASDPRMLAGRGSDRVTFAPPRGRSHRGTLTSDHGL